MRRLARWLYALALRLHAYPFRQAYAEEMRATFDALADDAAAHGRVAFCAWLVAELWDVGRARSASCGDRTADSASASERRPAVIGMWQDIRYASRMLRRQPGFFAVAVATLAIGIGATTAVFTVVNGVLLRPLPYRDPDRLVVLLNGQTGRLSGWFSPLNYRDVVAQSRVFDGAAAINPITKNLTGSGDPERLDGSDVSWNFFSVLGVTFTRGRGFVESDVQSGPAPVVVVSERLWRRRLGGRSDAIGSTLLLDGQRLTIVGIAPADVTVPAHAEFWRPLVFTFHDLEPRQRGAQWVTTIARLRPEMDVREAAAAVAAVYVRLAHDFPRINGNLVATAVPMHERLVGSVRPALLVLLGAVTLVLLIACANVANLLLARAQGRLREVAVRSALGAARWRLVRQFLCESLLLAGVGAAGGLFLAYGCVQALVFAAPASLPRMADIAIDRRVLAFVTLVAVGTSVLFGLAPALAATGGVVARTIGTAGRGLVATGGRMRRMLAVSELALALMLLVAAGLLIRSYERLNAVRPGFDPDGVLTFSIALPEGRFKELSDIRDAVAQIVARLEASPGVESAAGAFGVPFDTEFSAYTTFRRSGEADSADSPQAGMRVVTPDYFKTMRIPLRAGRLLDAHDDDHGAAVVVINEQAARRYWPGRSPIGERIHVGASLVRGATRDDRTIVGVVGDVKYALLDEPTPPELYLPHAQHPVDGLTIAVRTAGDPLQAVGTARAVVADLDRELPMANVRTMDQAIAQSVAQRRFTMALLASFAGIALVLAAIGVYGVLAYMVSQRTQEIGVRIAVGAAPGDVVGLFVREGLEIAAIGLALGLGGAFAATRLLSTLLFGVTATDPATFVSVGAALSAVAIAASYLPARRAARVDPVDALRV